MRAQIASFLAMLFALRCIDKPDGQHVRQSNRPEHLAYLEERAGQILYGGPLLAEDGETSVGSLLIIEAPDRAAAEAFAAGDPFGKAGLFASVEITATKRVFPKEEGGGGSEKKAATEEQMSAFEEQLKNDDWGHQPC